jgi:hypothetical protein
MDPTSFRDRQSCNQVRTLGGSEHCGVAAEGLADERDGSGTETFDDRNGVGNVRRAGYFVGNPGAAAMTPPVQRYDPMGRGEPPRRTSPFACLSGEPVQQHHRRSRLPVLVVCQAHLTMIQDLHPFMMTQSHRRVAVRAPIALNMSTTVRSHRRPAQIGDT